MSWPLPSQSPNVMQNSMVASFSYGKAMRPGPAIISSEPSRGQV